MKYISIIIFTFFLLNQCTFNKGFSNNIYQQKSNDNIVGFIFVDISKIYHRNGNLIVYSEEKDTILYLKDKILFVNRKEYNTIEEEYLYKDQINIETLNPEYGLFILKCYENINGFYKVEINGKIGLINNVDNNIHVEFKDINKFIMESYPIPTQHYPLRYEPNDSSNIINNFDEFIFEPIEIKGDWLKVRDSKDCYKGVAPSIVNIIGWIRWRKNGELILKVAHDC